MAIVYLSHHAFRRTNLIPDILRNLARAPHCSGALLAFTHVLMEKVRAFVDFLHNMASSSPIVYGSSLVPSSIYFLSMCTLDLEATHSSIISMRLDFRLLPFETRLHIELAGKTRCPVPLSALQLTTISPLGGNSSPPISSPSSLLSS